MPELDITTADKISNKSAPIDPTDKTELNADNVLLILKKIINFQYNTWTNATRPVPVSGQHPIGWNTSIGQFEGWDGSNWKTLGG